MENDYEVGDIQITLNLDNESTIICDVLLKYPLNDKEYIALSPSDDDSFDTIYLYRFNEDSNGQPVLTNIETDEEYEAVADRFDEILDEIEYDIVEADN